MLKGVTGYKVVVFDLDGTLYDQPKLRKIMALRLMTYYLKHPVQIRDLFLLMAFRKVKDAYTESAGDSQKEEETGQESGGRTIDVLDNIICNRVAEIKNTDAVRVVGVVKKWIYDNPLSAIGIAADAGLIDTINQLQSDGVKVVIFSDYPADDKLKSLGVAVDGVYSSTDKKIGELKPSPKGLRLIMEDYGVNSDEIIMVGDRFEKDGMAAQNAGIASLILPRKIKDRDNLYE